jgi:N-acetylneuraminate synthase
MNLTELCKPNSDIDDVYIIAEAGINHNGDFSTAKKLCIEAKKIGCDSIKFQKRNIDVVYSKSFLNEPRESPWGNTQRDQKLGLELSIDEFIEISEFCKEIKIDFSASAWDFESLDFIESLAPKYHKVASAFITNTNFLKKIARYRRPTFVSTGMCELKDVDSAVDIFKSENCPFVLMHSVSTYPTKIENLNLNLIKFYQERYKVVAGYSGHESGVSTTLFAAAFGAKVIERHFTLDRSMYGSDQAASLELEGMQRLVTGLRKFPRTIGN